MVLEELSHGQLIVECHSADEYDQIDALLKEFGDVDFEGIAPMSDGVAQARPYYYVGDERKPRSSRTLDNVFDEIGKVPWTPFAEFMAALYVDENAQESDLESVSLEGVL